ncbi:MAG: hypothetical protein KDD35_12105 [Bdellovibrionales bacterium]|nr:hypothetical protein [Bdellovibrionales bacterium]
MHHQGSCSKSVAGGFLLFLLSAFVLGFTMACTRESSPHITEGDFKKNTELMLNVSDKFLNESDIEKLHKVAVDLQLSRAIVCQDVGSECTVYLDFINKLIEYTKDGHLSPSEKTFLEKKRQELAEAVKKGEEILRKKWEKLK